MKAILLFLSVILLTSGLVVGQQQEKQLTRSIEPTLTITPLDKLPRHVIAKSLVATATTPTPTPLPSLTPNDPGYSAAWAAQLGSDNAYLKYLAEWMASPPQQKVAVIVLDTGIQQHRDLDRHHLAQFDVDLVGGTITNHHGSAADSVINADTNNNQDVPSVDGLTDAVYTVSVRVIRNDGSMPLSTEVAGLKAIPSVISQLTAFGIRTVAVNASFGGQGYSAEEDSAFRAITSPIDPTTNKPLDGPVVFAAAGPHSSGQCDFYPECLKVTNPKIISVGPLAATGDMVDPSVGGHPDFLAPGVNVPVVSFIGSNAASFSGSSAATPHAAALFAALQARRPRTPLLSSVEQMKFTSEATSDGNRRLNVFWAFTSRMILVGLDGAPTSTAALDAGTLTTGPFTVWTDYLIGGRQKTLVTMFAYNLDVTGDNPNVTVTANWQDTTLTPPDQSLPMPVVYAGPVPIPEQQFLSEIVVQIPDQLAGKTVQLSVATPDKVSLNQTSLTIK